MSNFLEHPQFGQIRTRKRGDDWHFCATDLCSVLELTNSRMAIQALDDDERCKFNLHRQGETWFVTESGLYALILRSRKPEARKFRKWITSEVLPALRKYGVYSTDRFKMERAEKRLERKTVNQMLEQLDESLSGTDKRLVARHCQTDEREVRRVLSGDAEDPYMLALCYGRATGNKMLRNTFYTLEGAEKIIRELKKP